MAITDARLVIELEKDFLADLDVSREINLESWINRPWHQRVMEHVTELVRQSL